MTNNIKPCPTCGQLRPAPTEPGEWEYCENILFPPDLIRWVRASVRLPLPNDRDGQEGLRLWQKDEETGKMRIVWWPQRGAAWRKVGETETVKNPFELPIDLMRVRHKLEKHLVEKKINDNQTKDIIEELLRIEMAMYKNIQ